MRKLPHVLFGLPPGLLSLLKFLSLAGNSRFLKVDPGLLDSSAIFEFFFAYFQRNLFDSLFDLLNFLFALLPDVSHFLILVFQQEEGFLVVHPLLLQIFT